MLPRIIATIAALAVIGLIALVAALPALAQSSGDSSGAGAAAPTATATATPTPGPTSFAITPRIDNPEGINGLARVGDKWYVSKYNTGVVHIFSGNGDYARSVNSHRASRGLAFDGANVLSVLPVGPRLFKWTPTASAFAAQPIEIALPSIPGGGKFRADGVAHDGTNTWVAIAGPLARDANRLSKRALIKVAADNTTTLYRTGALTTALAYENGFLYGLTDEPNPDLIRINPANLQPYTPAALLNLAEPPVNNWEVERRDIGIHRGLAFRNGVAYGFNSPADSPRQIRQARQPSLERLFALTPTIGDQLPHGITRVGDKWHVAGHSGDGYVHIFSNTGSYERRIKAPDATIRGLASDGASLFAAANSTANAISVADNSSVAVYVPKIYKWTPQANETAPASATTFCIPNALGYTPNGVAYDAGGTHLWAALDSPSRNVLVKLNATTGAHIGTYQMNNAVSGLTYKDGNLYALSNGAIVMAVASHLKTSPATWVNNWEVVKRDSGLHHGLVFRDRTAYGFNAAQDEVRAESGSPTIAAAPASPAGVASPTGAVPPTGADPSDAVAPAPNPATPSSGADANPSG